MTDEPFLPPEEFADLLHDAVKIIVAPLIARMRQLEARPVSGGVKYCGTFVAGSAYDEGSLCTRAGSLWCARRTTVTVPGTPGSDWQLIVKNGAHAEARP